MTRRRPTLSLNRKASDRCGVLKCHRRLSRCAGLAHPVLQVNYALNFTVAFGRIRPLLASLNLMYQSKFKVKLTKKSDLTITGLTIPGFFRRSDGPWYCTVRMAVKQTLHEFATAMTYQDRGIRISLKSGAYSCGWPFEPNLWGTRKRGPGVNSTITCWEFQNFYQIANRETSTTSFDKRTFVFNVIIYELST